MDLSGSLPAQMHQHGVDGHSVQPRRKAGITTERADLSKYPQKYLLGQILCVRCVLEHSQTEAVHSLALPLVEVFKSRGVAVLGSADSFWFSQLAFRFLRECVPHADLPSFK